MFRLLRRVRFAAGIGVGGSGFGGASGSSARWNVSHARWRKPGVGSGNPGGGSPEAPRPG